MESILINNHRLKWDTEMRPIKSDFWNIFGKNKIFSSLEINLKINNL